MQRTGLCLSCSEQQEAILQEVRDSDIYPMRKTKEGKILLVSRWVSSYNRHVKYPTFTMLRCCKASDTTVKRNLKYLPLGLLVMFKKILT